MADSADRAGSRTASLPVMWSDWLRATEGDTLTARLLTLLESPAPDRGVPHRRQGPTVGAGTDPDATLTAILGMGPRSETYVDASIWVHNTTSTTGDSSAGSIDLTVVDPARRARHDRRTRTASHEAAAHATRGLDLSQQVTSHCRRRPGFASSGRAAQRHSSHHARRDGDGRSCRAVTPPGARVPLLWILARHAALRQYA